MNIAEFEKNDWDHLHDVVYNVTGKKSTREELEKVFDSLSSHLKHLAYEWGMNDTVFREDAAEYLREKHNAEYEAKNKADNERNASFAAWVMKAIGDGRIYFSNRPQYYGESPTDELDVVVEFAGGPEVIGNDGSGSFSWRDLQRMVEEQGLLK
jgi:hypothetical protein